MIDLLPSEEQQQIIDSVAGFLEAQLPVTRLRPGPDGARPADAGLTDALWHHIASLGWFGLGVSEAQGGAGYPIVVEMLVARELGRHAVSPSVTATMAAAHLAARGGETSLASLIGGERRVAVANRVSAGGDEYHLIDGRGADCFLILEETETRLYHASAFGRTRPVMSLDDAVTLDRADLPASAQPLLRDATGDIAHRVSLLNSAQLLGVAEAALRLAVDYAGAREQFGQAIGSFQAIKHSCADMAVRAEAAYAQTFFAGLSQGSRRPDAAYQIAAAKVVSADAALANARACIQIHGGIGFTAECDAHVFLKRAHLLGQLGGERRWLRSTLLGSGV
ncbi:MAG: acyl-CoA/acyl-ACP dehydrogenase [Gammaproteobacteria bacterium]|nr:acyl-CoA/acyl-ACP dehydrogenase [Gammaproteobacteria bacterium]